MVSRGTSHQLGRRGGQVQPQSSLHEQKLLKSDTGEQLHGQSNVAVTCLRGGMGLAASFSPQPFINCVAVSHVNITFQKLNLL